MTGGGADFGSSPSSGGQLSPPKRKWQPLNYTAPGKRPSSEARANETSRPVRGEPKEIACRRKEERRSVVRTETTEEKKEEDKGRTMGDVLYHFANQKAGLFLLAIICYAAGAASVFLMSSFDCESSAWWNPISAYRAMRSVESNILVSGLSPATNSAAREAHSALSKAFLAILGVAGGAAAKQVLGKERAREMISQWTSASQERTEGTASNYSTPPRKARADEKRYIEERKRETRDSTPEIRVVEVYDDTPSPASEKRRRWTPVTDHHSGRNICKIPRGDTHMVERHRVTREGFGRGSREESFGRMQELQYYPYMMQVPAHPGSSRNGAHPRTCDTMRPHFFGPERGSRGGDCFHLPSPPTRRPLMWS